ncbi:MAG: type VI secretion system ImpA family N-terminal domain-containing protein [Phycisphaerales bacterium]|nr:type VI secretion system ImpA family N-terminal domain-containing protein [Phycisphaerales bacterium]
MATNDYIEGFLAPVSDESPAGIDVEYDPDFLQLEAMLPDTTESMLEPAEESSTDWRGIRNSAEGILKRSKHLPSAVLLSAALVETRGLPGLRDGLSIVQGIIAQYWDTFWPRIDEEDPDPIERVNILAGLSPPISSSDSIGFTRLVQDMPIVTGKLAGALTLKTIQSGANAEEGEADASVVLPDADPEDVEAASQATQDCLDSLEDIAERVSAQTDGQGIVDFGVLTGQLKEIHRPLATFLGQDVGDDDDDAGSSDGGQGGSGPIRSRSDVVAALDRITDWYAQNEPGSPIPLLLDRVRKMVHMSFPELMTQIFPDAVEGARLMVHEAEESNFD